MRLRPGFRFRLAVLPGSARRTRETRGLSFEQLEERRLLAVLNVGPGERYATIQAAVDAARPADVMLLADSQYTESVDSSRMGVVHGGATGDLIIRGTSSEQTSVTPDILTYP